MDIAEWSAAYHRAIHTVDTIQTSHGGDDMTYEPQAAATMITESARTIDDLRHLLAQERELADKLQLSLQALVKDYVTGELDPRTDELLNAAMGDYRQARQTWVS